MPELAVQAPKGMQTRGSLLDLLDRVLAKGVVAYGDIVLSIADLDLVYLNLRAVLSSIGTLESTGHFTAPADVPRARACGLEQAALPIAGGAPELWEERENLKKVNGYEKYPKQANEGSNINSRPLSSNSSSAEPPIFTETPLGSEESKAGRLKLDPQKTAQGLAKLAMTLINLLRKLMERQAIRRMEVGSLTSEQLERAGQAFQRLDDQIKELCNQFGLKEEDLNLDLGPLGKLV